jgi:hypothetical protein
VSGALAISLAAFLLAAFSTYRTYLRGEELTVVVAWFGVRVDRSGVATLIFTNSGTVPVVVQSVQELKSEAEGELVTIGIRDLTEMGGRDADREHYRDAPWVLPFAIEPGHIRMIDIALTGVQISEAPPGRYDLVVYVRAIGPSGRAVHVRLPLATIVAEARAVTATTGGIDDDPSGVWIADQNEKPTRILTSPVRRWLQTLRLRKL